MAFNYNMILNLTKSEMTQNFYTSARQSKQRKILARL